jgi:hypothetical protein
MRQIRRMEGYVFYSIRHIVMCERALIADHSTLLGASSSLRQGDLVDDGALLCPIVVQAAKFTRLAALQALAPALRVLLEHV